MVAVLSWTTAIVPPWLRWESYGLAARGRSRRCL